MTKRGETRDYGRRGPSRARGRAVVAPGLLLLALVAAAGGGVWRTAIAGAGRSHPESRAASNQTISAKRFRRPRHSGHARTAKSIAGPINTVFAGLTTFRGNAT